jgi:hypothetical protein
MLREAAAAENQRSDAVGQQQQPNQPDRSLRQRGSLRLLSLSHLIFRFRLVFAYSEEVHAGLDLSAYGDLCSQEGSLTGGYRSRFGIPAAVGTITALEGRLW